MRAQRVVRNHTVANARREHVGCGTGIARGATTTATGLSSSAVKCASALVLVVAVLGGSVEAWAVLGALSAAGCSGVLLGMA